MTMTISEALKRLARLVVDHGASLDDATAWDVIRSRLEVSDEMAETALRVWRSCDPMMHAPAAMKAALVAALGE